MQSRTPPPEMDGLPADALRALVLELLGKMEKKTEATTEGKTGKWSWSTRKSHSTPTAPRMTSAVMSPGVTISVGTRSDAGRDYRDIPSLLPENILGSYAFLLSLDITQLFLSRFCATLRHGWASSLRAEQSDARRSACRAKSVSG